MLRALVTGSRVQIESGRDAFLVAHLLCLPHPSRYLLQVTTNIDTLAVECPHESSLRC